MRPGFARLCVLLVGSLQGFGQSISTVTATSAPATVPRLLRFTGQVKGITGAVGITFSLYKGPQDGPTLWIETQTVKLDDAGKYSVLLGATKAEGIPMEQFTSGEAQWLGVRVDGQPEQARVLLVSVPYALKAAEADTLSGHTLNDFVTAEKLSAAVEQQVQARSNTTPPKRSSVNGVLTSTATNFADTTTNQVVGVTQSGTGKALVATAASNTAIYGNTTATTGSAVGVYGQSASTGGVGIYGYSSATSGSPVALFGSAASTAGIGIAANETATSGVTTGLQSTVFSPKGIAAVIQNKASGQLLSGRSGAANTEVFSVDGAGVVRTSGSLILAPIGSQWFNLRPINVLAPPGVDGMSISAGSDTNGGAGGVLYGGNGTAGQGGDGIDASAGSGATRGGTGISATGGAGPQAGGFYGGGIGGYFSGGQNTSSSGVGGTGMIAVAGSGPNGTGDAADFYGFLRVNTGSSSALSGVDMVAGDPGCGTGWAGLGFGPAPFDLANCANYNLAGSGTDLLINRVIGGAIHFRENNGDEMVIASGGNVTIAGSLSVTGSISAGTKDFVIDYPLDPANKLLYHTSIESPDMKTLYDGVARLDAKGEAWVSLPEYFEALNQDFRYALTPLDRAAPYLHVSRRIHNNRFKISGGKPNMEVSWQVTGIRHDAYANANRGANVVDKPATQRGKYLHPESFGTSPQESLSAGDR